MSRHITRLPWHRASRQRGATLLVALCMLIVMLLAGASAARIALQGEKAARNERDRHIAFQAAEEALMDAQRDIEGKAGQAGRSALFASDSAAGFSDGCGTGKDSNNLGLCLAAEQGKPPVWQQLDLADDGADSHSVPLGRYSGVSMPTGAALLPFRRPRYIIELVPYNKEGEEAGSGTSYFYRVTAIGFGSRPHTEVVLQSYYRKQGRGEVAP